MKYYNDEILAIFKDWPGILNNRYNPVIRLKSFFNTSYVSTPNCNNVVIEKSKKQKAESQIGIN